MGLDMYLEAEKYISEWNQDTKGQGEQVSALFPELKGKKIKTVTAEVMYWRKANAIHNWFVNNVQNGVDECQRTYIPIEKLEELLAVCKLVIKLKGKKSAHQKVLELLPPTSGFFFGSTDIDAYFYQDVEETIKGLEDLLTDDLFSKWDIYYRSSW